MKTKIGNLIITALILIVPLETVKAESKRNQEYKVKAAFLYNFIKFVEWPKEKVCFEIHNKAAKQKVLDIRSKL